MERRRRRLSILGLFSRKRTASSFIRSTSSVAQRRIWRRERAGNVLVKRERASERLIATESYTFFDSINDLRTMLFGDLQEIVSFLSAAADLDFATQRKPWTRNRKLHHLWRLKNSAQWRTRRNLIAKKPVLHTAQADSNVHAGTTSRAKERRQRD